MLQPMDVLSLFPVRKSKKQKSEFRDTVIQYCESLGYRSVVEKGSMGVRNLVIGDPEQAKYVITAHYDTCAGLPFPNLITPCSFWLFAAWQLLLVVILCVPAGVVGGLLGLLFGEPSMAAFFAYLLLLAELVWMMIGPANKRNANDNTSGVVTVLETAASIPPELRDQVCFVLFDLEEAGLLGSSAYRKAHRKATSRQIILNVDCVGEGNEILLFPTGKLKKDKKRLNRLGACCAETGEKAITLKQKGFAIYPSDQSNFPIGLGIAAFCRSKWAGLYLAKIHTRKDTVLDEKNVAVIRDFLVRVIREKA